jgi:uncharacterized DUF497 family protein
MMYTTKKRFEWDDRKARANALKHGIGFKEATTAFHDKEALIADDPDHSRDEKRLWLIGESARGRLLVVVFTARPGSSTRLISARPAGREARRHYEQNRGISF